MPETQRASPCKDQLKIRSNFVSLLLPMTLPFFARQGMLIMPGALLDAARIDGCAEFSIFWLVFSPKQ